MRITRLLAAVSLFGFSAAAQASLPPSPSLKPDRPYASRVVSTQDAELVHDALDAASSGQWRDVVRLQARARSETAADLILWRLATSGPPEMGFRDLSDALDRLEGWPRRTQIQVRAESLIGQSGLSPDEQIAWFDTHAPVSGAGRAALAIALDRSGETERALEIARIAWRGNGLDRAETDRLFDRFEDQFTQDDIRARVDYLLWTRQRSAAQRLVPRLTRDWRALVDARIRLQANRSGVDSAINAVPSPLQTHPGLLFDRAQWRRQRGRHEGAVPLLVDIDGADIPAAGRNRLWDERNLAARREIKATEFDTAYALAAPHGMQSGVDFAEAEWLAGWLALRKRDDALQALDHFQALDAGVSTPISQSRADYWIGRAHTVLNEQDAALAAYGRAAEYRYTFYGQLAAERTDDRTISFESDINISPEARDAFNARPLVRALKLLAEAGESRLFRQFSYHLDDVLESAEEVQLLKELADTYLYTDIGVRGAKAALSRGIVAPDAAYPVVTYPLLREPQVERSLMLALSRQESEMNPRAISHANARGLMQFIPATAQREARQRGLPYRTSWLTDDPGYNMTLGGAHLDTLLSQFNGSYIMAAAAYNAGARRPRQWVIDYGDPRRGEIHPIDWVESIPFSETRNYVQRVLENTQVYRHRLTGEEEDIQLSDDLARGQNY